MTLELPNLHLSSPELPISNIYCKKYAIIVNNKAIQLMSQKLP